MGRRMNSAGDTGQRKTVTAADLAQKLPAPPPHPIGDAPKLVLDEPQIFAQCEAAVETLKWAFWAAGKALQVIRDGRLYRENHQTFDDYLEARWDMQRAYADKLIRTWRIAEALFESQSNGLTPIGVKKLNQAMVWELVPVAERHGLDAAQLVYRTVVEVDDVPVTAAVLKGAVRALPSGEFATEKAIEQIRAYLAALRDGEEDEPPAIADSLDTEAKKIRSILRRVTRQDRIRQHAAQNPEEVRQFVTDLRELLDEVERDVLAAERTDSP